MPREEGAYKVWWPHRRKRRSLSARFGLGWELDPEKLPVASESLLRNSHKPLVIHHTTFVLKQKRPACLYLVNANIYMLSTKS